MTPPARVDPGPAWRSSGTSVARSRVMRWTRGLLALGALAVLAVLGVALAGPEVLRRLALRRLEGTFAAPARIEDVDANFLTGRARVRGLVIGGAPGKPEILRLPTLDLDLSYRALLRGEIRLDSVTVHAPRLHVERERDGGFNVLRVWRPAAGGTARGVSIGWIRIADGQIDFVDQTETPPLHRLIANVRVIARDVSTLSGHVDRTSFEAALGIGDGTVTLTGTARPFGRPGDVDVVAHLRQVDAGVLEPYVPAGLDLRDGRLDLDVRYLRTPGPTPRHLLEAGGRLGPARLAAEPGRDSAVLVRALRADGVRVDLARQTVTIAELGVEAPRVRVLRESGGDLEIARVLAPLLAPAPPGRAPPAAPPGPPAPYGVSIARIRIDGGEVAIRDATVHPAAAIDLHELSAHLTGVGLTTGAPAVPVSARARLGDHGSLAVAGRLRWAPLEATLTADVAGLPMETFQPYADAALGVRTVRRGLMGGRFEVRLAAPAGGATRLAVGGRLEGRDLAFGVPGIEDPLLTTERLVVDLREVSLLPVRAADVARIQLIAPVLRLRRDEEGRLDARRLWDAFAQAQASRAPAAAGGSPAAAAPPAPSPDRAGPPLRIAHIELTRGRVLYRDAAVQPAFHERMVALAASLRDLAGDGARSPVRLSARIGDAAPLELAGWVQALGGPLRVELHGSLEGYDLSRLRPLPERLVGYQVRSGQATVEVEYRYDGQALTGSNTITVRHLDVAPRGEDRVRAVVGLPLPSVLKLLPHRDGALRIQVPVSGDLARPQVRLGPLIADAVRSAVVRTITAPFRLLGGVLVRAGRIEALEVPPLPFTPGTVTPVEDAVPRLTELIDLLAARPGLAVRVEGHTGAADVAALKRERLERAIAATGRSPRDALRELYAEAGGDPTLGAPSEDQMRERVLAAMAVTDADLRKLARSRGRVLERLLEARDVRREQLVFVEPDTAALARGPEVQLALVY